MYNLSKIGWKFGRKWGKTLFRGLRTRAGLASIRMFVCGGGPLVPEIPEWFNLIGFSFIEGYGLTECSPVVTVNRFDNIKFGSVGPALPEVEIAIDKPSDDGIGEILVRGDNTTPGYVDNPSATSALLEDGWLHTGDLGIIIDDHLYIRGRAKSLIVTAAGKNVHPEEIEEILSQSDYIAEVLIVGRDREGRMGEDICAIIFPDIEQLIKDDLVDPINPEKGKIRDVIAAEIKDTNEELASFKRINKFDLRFEEFVKTSTKKIKRNLYN